MGIKGMGGQDGVLLLLLLLLLGSSEGFNLDTDSAVVYQVRRGQVLQLLVADSMIKNYNFCENELLKKTRQGSPVDRRLFPMILHH